MRLQLSVAALSISTAFLVAPAGATTWHVAIDGSGDFTTIQAGVDAAVDGDSILVAPGNYPEDVRILNKALTVLSEAGPAVTTVHGTTTFRIYYVLEGTTVVEGLGISGSDDAIDTYFSTVHLVSNDIGGGGSGILGRSSTLTIAGNDVQNHTGPGIILTGSTATVTGNTIENNGSLSESGGGIQASHTTGSIENNVIEGNLGLEGAGVWLGPRCDFEVTGNRIARNGSTASEGGGLGIVEADARLNSNLFLENTGDYAGALWVDNLCVVEITENTFVGNAGDGAVAAVGNAIATFEGNIFAGNEGNVFFRARDHRATTEFTCNILWPQGPDAPDLGAGIVLGIDGNVATDPAFCDAGAEDFHLDASSPAAATQSAEGCGRIGAFDPACGTPGHVLIQGGVKDLDGSPLEGALIEATGTEPAQGITDADGRFRLDVVPGSYVITASHDGDDLWPASRILDGLDRTTDGQNFFVTTTPRTLRVAEDGSGDATTLQGGINLAQPFDTVLVAPGTYTVADVRMRGLPLIVRAEEGPATTIVDAEYPGPGRSVFWARDGEPVETTVEGFTIRSGRTHPVRIEYGSGLTLRGCVLTENDLAAPAVVWALGEGRLEQNLVVENDIHDQAAIALEPMFRGVVRGNLVVGSGVAMRVDADVPDFIRCNILWDNEENAITGLYPLELGQNGNVAIDPHFCDRASGDYTLNHASPGLPGQHPLGESCGQIGPYGIGCTDGPFYYVTGVDPPSGPYTGSTVVSITGWNFPGSVSSSLDLDGVATRAIVLDTVTSSLLEGTVDLYEAPPGLWDVVVADGGEEARLVDSFDVPSVTVAALEPDTVSTSSPSDTIRIHGTSFLPDVEVWFTNQLGEVETVEVLDRTEELLRVVYAPLGRRGRRALVLANASVETLTVAGALWVNDVPRTLRVPADYPTIQDGLTAALSGDTVLVAAGEYQEQLRIVAKHVCLRSQAGPTETVLRGDGEGSILSIWRADSTTVEGFAFVGGFTEYGGSAISIGDDSMPRISDNVFRNNVAYIEHEVWTGGEGGAIFSRSGGVIERNVFEENRAGLFGGAIAWSLEPGSASLVIRDNLFLRNDSEQGAAMAGFGGYEEQMIVVEGNTLVDNVGWTQMSIEGSFELNRNIFAMVDRIPSEYEMALACVISLPTASAARSLDQRAQPFMVDVDNATWEFERVASCNLVSFIEEDCLPRPEWECEGFEATDTFCGVDPLFCDPEIGNYELGPHSPIHPDSTDCGRIGAFGPCVIVPTEETPPAGGPPVPLRWALGTPSPNPFNPTLRIPVAVPSPGGGVAIRVFDSGGRLVRVLIDEPLDPGRTVIVWDGRTASGAEVASGVYFLRMEAPGFHETRSAILLR